MIYNGYILYTKVYIHSVYICVYMYIQYIHSVCIYIACNIYHIIYTQDMYTHTHTETLYSIKSYEGSQCTRGWVWGQGGEDRAGGAHSLQSSVPARVG